VRLDGHVCAAIVIPRAYHAESFKSMHYTPFLIFSGAQCRRLEPTSRLCYKMPCRPLFVSSYPHYLPHSRRVSLSIQLTEKSITRHLRNLQSRSGKGSSYYQRDARSYRL
jgi:hypothetical protein